MRIALDRPDLLSITRYEPGLVRVGGQDCRRCLLLAPGHLDIAFGPDGFAQLAESHFAAMLQFDPELVLVGTGALQQFADPSLLRPLLNAGVGCEFMDTGAACRTYNILLGEGRRVVALLYPA